MSAHPIGRSSGAVEIVAGFLCAFAIFFSLIGLVWHPLRLIPISFVLTIIATGMVGRTRRLPGVAAAIVGVCFFLGFVISVLAHRPLW